MPKQIAYVMCLDGDVPKSQVLPNAVKRQCRQCKRAVWYSNERTDYPPGLRLVLLCFACTQREMQNDPDVQVAPLTDRAQSVIEQSIGFKLPPDVMEDVLQSIVDDLRYPRDPRTQA